jgi:GNAT superfamily N-acetyltransferase
MEFRSARRDERGGVLDLLANWYGERDFFARYNLNDPSFRDELCIAALDGSRLVGTVQIFDRAIMLDGHRVPMGGIGSVFTLEQYRHRSIASSMMKLAIETMERAGFEVSLLFAERITFYKQFGWREISRKFSVLAGRASLSFSSPDRFQIDSFDAVRDLPAVAAIHREYSGRLDVTALRDDDSWRASLAFAGNQPLHPGEGSDEYFVVCRAGETIEAYARVTGFHGVAMVMEYGYRHGQIDAMLAILRYFGEVASRRPPTARLAGDHRRSSLLYGDSKVAAPGVIVTHSAHDPELEARLASAGSPAMHHDDSFYMWRIISRERLGRRLGLAPEAAEARAFELFASDRSLFWTSDRF